MKTVTLTDAQWTQILKASQDHWDEGPTGQGWQSAELKAAGSALEKALELSPQESRETLLATRYAAHEQGNIELFNEANYKLGLI